MEKNELNTFPGWRNLHIYYILVCLIHYGVFHFKKCYRNTLCIPKWETWKSTHTKKSNFIMFSWEHAQLSSFPWIMKNNFVFLLHFWLLFVFWLHCDKLKCRQWQRISRLRPSLVTIIGKENMIHPNIKLMFHFNRMAKCLLHFELLSPSPILGFEKSESLEIKILSTKATLKSKR